MKNNYLLLGISLIVHLVLISSILVYFMLLNKEPIADTTFSFNKHSMKQSDISTKNFRSSVTLKAVGDILIHGTLYNSAQTTDGYDFSPMFSEVKSHLEDADITFANQETMIGGETIGLSTYPRFNSPYNVADTLKDVGIDIVSIANNHTLDRGEQALLNATSYFDQIGLLYTGGYRTISDSQVIRTITRKGITFSFLAYTYGTNGIPIPKNKPYIVNLIDYDKMTNDIKAAKKISDVVVVSLHFGNEYQRMPSDDQKEIAAHAVNMGANIILGHHPHVLQPMEWIEAENGNKGFVVYSLGNFLSGQKSIYREIGGILTLTIQKEIKNGSQTIEVKEPTFLPTYVSKNGYKIVPLKNASNYGLPNSTKWLAEIDDHMHQLFPENQMAQAN
ncbi:CapA family protein [Bacillus salitolerans]|uniref:CapA family protein n=1 Tax=Bacillus salitolerans TaxID=1437434 RepID=A0ABW4LRG9_9BACI